jgi:hypothetical protein
MSYDGTQACIEVLVPHASGTCLHSFIVASPAFLGVQHAASAVFAGGRGHAGGHGCAAPQPASRACAWLPAPRQGLFDDREDPEASATFHSELRRGTAAAGRRPRACPTPALPAGRRREGRLRAAPPRRRSCAARATAPDPLPPLLPATCQPPAPSGFPRRTLHSRRGRYIARRLSAASLTHPARSQAGSAACQAGQTRPLAGATR